MKRVMEEGSYIRKCYYFAGCAGTHVGTGFDGGGMWFASSFYSLGCFEEYTS